MRSVKHLVLPVLWMLIISCILMSCGHELISPVPNTSITTTTPVPVPDTSPSFNNPSGVAVDAAGNLYVADYGNNLIRKITAAGVVTTLAGSGNAGSLNATGLLASFSQPKGITIDASGNLYIADSGNNLIRKVTNAGIVTTVATNGLINGGLDSALFSPSGVAVDVANNLYVADSGNDRIIKVTSAGSVSILAANVTNQLTNGPFDNPTGVAVDASGNIYVANYLTNTIALVTAAGTTTTFAGSGVQGYNDGSALTATFYFPNNVAVDAGKNVYVSDGVNNVIRKITPAGMVTTLAGSGIAGAIDSTGTAASFNGPAGLTVDASGNVYVVDSNNNKIRKITAAGKVTTVAGSGKYGSRNGIAKAGSNTKLIFSTGKNILNTIYTKPVKTP